MYIYEWECGTISGKVFAKDMKDAITKAVQAYLRP